MSAFSIGSQRQSYSLEWFTQVKEEDRNWMSLLEPCIFAAEDVSPRQLARKDESYLHPIPKYIPLVFPNVSGTTTKVYIYLRSFGLLNITPQKAYQASKVDKLYVLFKAFLEQLSPSQKETLILFKPIFNHYRLNRGDKSIDPTKHHKTAIKYNKRGLVYLIKQCVQQFKLKEIERNARKREAKAFVQESSSCHSVDTASSTIKDLSEKEKTALKIKRNVKFPVSAGVKCYTKLTKGKILIVGQWAEELGSGMYSRVYKSFNYSTGSFQALKKPKSAESAIRHIMTEAEILQYIYQRKSPEESIIGIMDPPVAHFIFPSKTSSKRFYKELLVTEYPYTLDNYFDDLECPNLDFHYALDGFKQLVMGLKHLEICGVLHGDIKPENVFVVFGTRPTFLLADFGGTKIADHFEIGVQRFYGTTCSPSYLSHSDCLEMAICTKEGQIEKWKRIHRARDLLALFLVGLELFSRQYIDVSTASYYTRDHLPELLEIIKSIDKTKGAIESTIRSLSELLDLRKLDKHMITEILKSAGCDNPQLVNLFAAVLQDKWELRPSLDEVITAINEIQ